MKTLEINDKQRVDEIISRCSICYVGITDLEGNPYVIPMNFGYKDNTIYIHSGPTGSCIDMLNKNNNVCITFCSDTELVHQHAQVACSYRMKAQSIVCKGKVTFVEDMDQKRDALNILMGQYVERDFTYSDPAVRNVKIWKIPIDSLTARDYAVPHQKKAIM